MTYADIAAFVTLPRTTGLAVSPDGRRLVASVQTATDARYVSALWEIPLDGGEPRRLTRSDAGETSLVLHPDGRLLFVSKRPRPEGSDDPALWALPASGEPEHVADLPGGVEAVLVAARAGTTVLGGSVLVGPSAGGDDDSARRRSRKDHGITAIVHTGMPIRYWDSELGDTSSRLFMLGDGGASRDLTPDAGVALVNHAASISADGATIATTWRTRRPGGVTPYGVVLIDTATGERRELAAAADVEFSSPRISPDGSRVALLREDDGDFGTPMTWALQVHTVDGGGVVEADLGDLYPTEYAWAPDGEVLYVSGDHHGRGRLAAVDPRTGAVTAVLADDAVYVSLAPAPGGRVYALRSAIDSAPAPVLVTVDGVQALPDPAPTPELPGTLHELDVEVGDHHVHAWLCLPHAASAATPAPVMQWIHGGPFMSYNSWSWRWSPWVAVAQGWAVVLPDPALSTGYGADAIARAWPHRAGLVWRDVEGVLDAVLQRPDVDACRTVCLGGSFGGYMTNWIAGHTDRFRAIVTHAGLWALDQQHTTTDAAHWKSGLFGTPADHPDWYAENSPHHFADRIVTPMLVIHGNRDYRVPVSEALRLWWDLVSRWRGTPDDLPHRFLQFTTENHWVLTPGNARVWYETVLDFCAEHAGTARR
ncbi:MAG: S9 family peptidase [Jatrophihabitans sp.]|uniref:S9 family peptidase n=1 Tax=Jatrophihabitans sp. TaxID=1932789 RepID=UPI003F80220E